MNECEAILEGTKRAFPEMRARLAPGLDRPGTEVPVDAPLVQGLLRASRQLGLEPRIEGMSAWVDAALLNEAGIPAVCFGPGSISQAHAADEWIAVIEIEQAAAVLYRFARELLSGRGPGDR